MTTDEKKRLSDAVEPLIRWFRCVRKPLPWRQDPTPYHVWISEIMLQQTRIEAVIPYYHRFLEAFPDVVALASSPEDKLMKLWEGLGYYSRARNLKKTAQQIVDRFDGVMPSSAEELRKLPGIGDYTAGAIASLAYGKPEPAVDGNVLRVIARLNADDRDVMRSATRIDIADALRSVYPEGESAALLTEGLMELGETVCIPNGTPLCHACPWKGLCLSESRGEMERYPVRAPKKERRIEERSVLLVRADGKFAIRKRPSGGLLAGMWEFPNLEGKKTASQIEEYLTGLGLKVVSIEPCGKAKHVFSHVEWHMTGFLIDCDQKNDVFSWETPETICAEKAIPTAFKVYRNKTMTTSD